MTLSCRVFAWGILLADGLNHRYRLEVYICSHFFSRKNNLGQSCGISIHSMDLSRCFLPLLWVIYSQSESSLYCNWDVVVYTYPNYSVQKSPSELDHQNGRMKKQVDGWITWIHTWVCHHKSTGWSVNHDFLIYFLYKRNTSCCVNPSIPQDLRTEPGCHGCRICATVLVAWWRPTSPFWCTDTLGTSWRRWIWWWPSGSSDDARALDAGKEQGWPGELGIHFW
jgi:hypothetical protein